MPKSPRRKRDHIWFYGRWPRSYVPITIEGLILTFVVMPAGVLLLTSPAWLAKQGFAPWVGALCFAIGVIVLLVYIVLFVTHRGVDRNL